MPCLLQNWKTENNFGSCCFLEMKPILSLSPESPGRCVLTKQGLGCAQEHHGLWSRQPAWRKRILCTTENTGKLTLNDDKTPESCRGADLEHDLPKMKMPGSWSEMSQDDVEITSKFTETPPPSSSSSGAELGVRAQKVSRVAQTWREGHAAQLSYKQHSTIKNTRLLT